MRTDPKVQVFSDLLDYYPPRFSGNCLNLLLIDDAEAILDGTEYLRRLDEPSLMDERREYLLDQGVLWPFPSIRIESRPDPKLISEKLLHNLDAARRVLFTQERLAEFIDHRVTLYHPDAVAVIIADGLSYWDLADDVEAAPCLADGITTTEYGYRRVVGRPSISRRLFALGYVHQLAFTYYDASNALAGEIHRTFSESQVVRVGAFEEVLKYLGDWSQPRCYIQVTLAGLDHLCHAHPDRPPRGYYIQHILDNHARLTEMLAGTHRRVLVVLTADHGILWREDVEDTLHVVDDLFSEDLRSPRYVRGAMLRPYGRVCREEGQSFTLLGWPWMTREFRNNEWGVHGGISAWESVVPLVIAETYV